MFLDFSKIHVAAGGGGNGGLACRREKFVRKELGAKGLGWARWTDTELKSPLARHVGEDRLKQAYEATGGGIGDLLLIVAGERPLVADVLGGTVPEPCWVPAK